MKRPLFAATALALLLLPAPSQAKGNEIARVQDGRGNHVAWLDVPETGEIQIEVATKFPAKPLVAAAFAERHDPAEIFLAVASPRRPVPQALLDRAPTRINTDSETRQRLRQANLVELARLPVIAETRVGSCTNSFRTWVGSVYGATSCGAAGNAFIDTTFPTDTYCKSGCDYPLGALDAGSCTVGPWLKLENCDIVTGTTTNLRLRTTSTGSPSLQNNGYWAHFGAGNCSGNGPIDFRRERGNSTFSTSVQVGHFVHFYQGSWNARRQAADLVSFGLWSEGLSPSGVWNKGWIEDNGGSNDLAILCGDIRTKITMSQSTCHGANISLCYPGDCDSSCWKCVGGSCG
jgi:hypothetical protein